MNRYTEIFERASRLTDQQLATEIAALGPFNRDKLQELLPRTRDREVFLELMRVVEDESDMDKKLAYLKTSVDILGPVILKVLRGLL